MRNDNVTQFQLPPRSAHAAEARVIIVSTNESPTLHPSVRQSRKFPVIPPLSVAGRYNNIHRSSFPKAKLTRPQYRV